MSKFIILFYSCITLWSVGSIILHGSRATKSLSWLLTVLALPFAGPILYYLFGVNRRKFTFFRLQQTEKRKLYNENYQKLGSAEQETPITNPKYLKLSKLIKENCFFSVYAHNAITIYDNGKQTFDALFKAIEGATSFIHLQYYIFEKGKISDRLYELLSQKIKEGVEVRLLYDAVGSFSFRNRIIKKFKKIGVMAYPTMPLKFGNLLFTLNYRNHRKIVVIDGRIGFIGGVNVSDKYIQDTELGFWKDMHLKVEGPAVDSLHRIFIKDYHFASQEELLLSEKYLPKHEHKGKACMQLVTSGPDSKQPAVMQQYIAMINSATESISIANPYFVPGTTVLQALKIAALSGIKVSLLIPKKSDSLMVKYSMFSRFEELLAIGVHIYLRDDFSHSKVILIDEELASIGSGNFDHRSFEHNFEANALIYDQEVVQIICEEFQSYFSKNDLLAYESFKKRSILRKFLEGLAKFFSPLL